ncbi:helix-turn-helix transcriptional regulator [Streptomyces sp. NBC_01233]|uniref:helix-turn-helix transcriptional regulator n=1 Tax=Streptomyces sp. NBC_01233 TaxID=2903787 RepID=UPI002E102CDD|nr:helix-turn-helix domain-containing protein [Streptomyces sp. NBC_01233]
MAAETIGHLLKRLRDEHGWTQQQVADEYCRVSSTMAKDAREVGRWERSTRVPTPETRRNLAVVFGVPAGVFDRAAAVAREARQEGPVEGSAPAHEELIGMDRRTFVGAVAAASFSTAMATPRYVDPALIPYFQQQLEGHYRADMMLGSRALTGTVTAQCDLIGQLVDTADGPTRQQMAHVGVSYAAFAAWLYLDAGDPTTALRWHDVAQELAHRSRDREAVACALVDRAMARTDQAMGRAVVDLCEGALMDAPRLSPEVQAFALQQQAHGVSLLGGRRQVDELLDKAGRLVDAVDVEVWGTACLRTPHYVEVQRATCYGRLGLAREADRLWQEIIPSAPPTARRDIAVWAGRQAVAAASLREPERAVELARRAAGIVVETGSERARRELGAVETAMAPWQAEPIGQDLAEVLAPIGKGV